MIEFEGFGKIPRLKKNVVITEKIDGTNAQICVYPDEDGVLQLQAGSRNRWIYPGDDNFGFAAWCEERKQELIDFLGEGRHFGEWYGAGVGRRYDLDEKKLALFNVHRWGPGRQELPDFLQVVPILYQGDMINMPVDTIMGDLLEGGSVLVPGFMNPEGIIIYHTAARQYYKTTFEHDKGKWFNE